MRITLTPVERMKRFEQATRRYRAMQYYVTIALDMPELTVRETWYAAYHFARLYKPHAGRP